MKQTFVKFAQIFFPQNYKKTKEKTEGDDEYGLSECRISRQIAIFQRNAR